MASKGTKQIIQQLIKYELDIRHVSDECKYKKDIITAERKHGLRQELIRGYDVILNNFFVEEKLFY